MANEKYFGVMLDMSRNGVMKVEKVKEYVDYLVKIGYNMIQLYTEETFEVENEPYFGYMRGRYSFGDMIELDKYCVSKGVELIPCVQTLAHLNGIFKWNDYKVIQDTQDILLAEEERTYTLIDNIFKTLAKCFTSRRVNIGMDEAHMLGLGAYLSKHGYQNRFGIIKKHLEKVIEIANKYGFKPMMWSDMFYRLANKGNYYGTNNITEEVKNSVPKGVDLVYWDYYHTDEKIYKNMISNHLQFNNDIWFAGGAWTWSGFAPDIDFTLKTMKPAIKVLKKKNVDKIMFTMWGDDGSETSYFSTLPVLFYLKEYYDGNRNLKDIKAKFKALTGEDYDAMVSLQLGNSIFKNSPTRSTTRYLVYGDLFNFFYNDIWGDEYKDKLLKGARKLKRLGKDSKFKYLFDYESDLLYFLSIKYNLAFKIRKAYKDNDKEELKLIIKDITKLEKYLNNFYKSFRNFWYTDRNPFGFDVSDGRFGALKQRIASCKERLNDYVEGKISKIDELEIEFLPYASDNRSYACWRDITTVNRIW